MNKQKQRKKKFKKSCLRKTMISSLKSSNKKQLLIFIPATRKSKPKMKHIYEAIIDINVYYVTHC